MEKIRLQKYLSEAWICSRRKAEEYIIQKQITVNWEIAVLGMKVDKENDEIKLLEKAIQEEKQRVYYKINKPRWIITTCAQHWEENIIDIVDIKQRVFPIWRLDKESDWLIILTNDWRLTNFLIHPRYEHEKEYLVEVFGPIDDDSLDQLRWWMEILWKITKKAKVKRVSSWTFSIVLTEGKNRQIRRMVEKTWNTVKKLKRIRIENIELWKLAPGEYKSLSNKELTNLFDKLWIKKL